MKRSILILIVLAFTWTHAQAQTVRLDIGEWPPYTSENDPDGKIAEIIVTEALHHVGIKPEFRYYPWKRSYENTKIGKAAGTFPWSLRDEMAKDFIIHKEPILTVKTVFFHLKTTNFDWNTPADLKAYKIGVTRGYQEEKLLREQSVPVEVVADESLNYKKLMGGRIQVCTGDQVVGQQFINKLFKEEAAKITYHPTPLNSGATYMLISKKLPDGQAIADKLDEGLRALKASGRYEEIMKAAMSR